MRKVAVVQARTGSSRLPGKVLLPLAGRPVLDHVVTRVSAAGRIDDVVVATSDQPGDDAIADYCRDRGWTCVRGSETDVLSRYAKSVKRTYAEELQRLRHWSPGDAEVLRSLKRTLLRGQALAGAEKAHLAEVLAKSRALSTLVAMRHELAALWERSSASKEQLLRQLQDWCHRAETSGVASLVDFSRRLRSYAVA